MPPTTNKINEPKANAHKRVLLNRIEKAHRGKKSNLATRLSRIFLKSFEVRFLACLESASSLKRLGKRIPSKKKLLEIAEEIDAWKGTNEPAFVSFIPKNEDGHDFRPIVSFGIRHRTLQHLVLPVLRARAVLHPNQFYTRGGAKGAIGKAIKALNAGYKYVIEIDVENCFNSFDEEKLPGLLPLPKEVTRRVIISRYFNFISTENTGIDHDVWANPGKTKMYPAWLSKDIAAVRAGISQGSATSPIVCEMLLCDMISQLPNCGIAVNYADNFWIMGREKSDVTKMEQALRCAFLEHPAGPLKSSWSRRYSPGESVSILGHVIERRSGDAIPKPSPQNLNKFKKKFGKHLDDIEFRKKAQEYQTRTV